MLCNTSRLFLYMAESGPRFSRLFSIGTFNILAPCHKRVKVSPSGTSKREIRFPERYLPRHEGILDLIRSAGPPDIVCLQEFSVARKIIELFESKFDGEYVFHHHQRPGIAEGLYMMIRRSIKVVEVIPQELGSSWSRIGLHALLEVGGEQGKVLISTTHLEYPHSPIVEPFQIGQLESLLQQARDIANRVSDPVTIFVCGDMNAPPDSKVYKTVCKHGYQSAYHAVNKKEPSVTHKDHRGNQVAADYVFYRMESAVPVSAELFPQHYTDSVWPEEFQLSDHRLLVTQFELKSDRLSLEEMWYRSSATAEERRQCCFSLCGRGLTDANL